MHENGRVGHDELPGPDGVWFRGQMPSESASKVFGLKYTMVGKF